MNKNEVFKLIDLVYEATRFACNKHDGQLYGVKPYRYHLNSVHSNLLYLFFKDIDNLGDKEMLMSEMCAWLHDVVEDTKVTIEDLRKEGYPEEVVLAVDLVTKKDELNYTEYLRLISRNDIAFKVKVADTYSNLTESLKDQNIKRIRKYSLQLEKLHKLRKEFLDSK